jgi:DNA-binding transcriptional LysR family regulator
MFRRLAKLPAIAAECSNHSTLFELVRSGVGATLISDSIAAAVNTDGIAIRHIRPRLNAKLIAIRRTEGSPAAHAFTAMLENS